MKLPDFSIVILAAGNSSRLGQPKQFLPFKGETLITKIVSEAINSRAKEIIIVANPNDIKLSEITQAQIVHNLDWEKGMSTSIAAGIRKVKTDEVIITVCDQPYVTAGLLKQLIEKKVEQNKGIACCSYANTIGTPAAFNRLYFNSLLQLTGDEGAKKIIANNLTDTCKIEFREGVIDIDTEEDYRKIL